MNGIGYHSGIGIKGQKYTFNYIDLKKLDLKRVFSSLLQKQL